MDPRTHRTAPASALLVGVGGLGCPATLALAASGVARLTLVDPDVVELSNLHRQLWHHGADLGQPKVASAAAKLRAQFPHLEVREVQGAVTAGNAAQLLQGHDVALDCTDGVDVKFLLSDAAVLSGVPLVYAGVVRFEGLAMRIEPRQGPCLRCLFETPPADVPTCAQTGVLGAMAGVLGGLQAQLALAANQAPGVALLHVVDGLSLSARTVRVRRRADCPACADGAMPVLDAGPEATCRP